MDLWVVAAAAGAGYLAKYWQNIFRDSKSGFPSGSSVPYNPLPRALIKERSDKSGPISDLSSRKILDRYFGESSNESYSDGPSTTEVASTSTLPRENQAEELGEYESYEYEGGYSHRLGSDVSEMPDYHHKWDMGPSHMPRRRRNSWRRRRLHLQFVKPSSSLDSCVAAQMYRGPTEMENYVLSPHASPCAPILRPFLVTDGKRLIGRASGDFRDGLHAGDHLNGSDGVAGMPYLPRGHAADYSKEKLGIDKSQTDKKRNGHSKDGSPSGQFLFCLGISVGIMHAIIAQKLEVDKLKESLKQTEDLVHDLQEELEMKDSLTVKELIIDDSSQDAHETSLIDKELNMLSSEVDTNVLTKHADDESASLKETQSISKIEAELEAELERLELSMNVTTLQGKLSGAFGLENEFDEDIAELVQGELRTDLQRKSSSDPTPDRGSTPLSMNHGVSPHELTLRLHDVIQSRLQARIKELEAELSRTQMRVQHLESEKVHSSWREFWNSESSSNPSTPIVVEAHSPVAQQPQPVVMNLSGEALDAYNEACEELGKIKGFQNDEDNNHTNGHKVSNGNPDEGSPNVDEGSPGCDEESDDNDDSDDDLLLIKQIVAKAKQGAPAVLRAQRALVYLEKQE